jgi:ABC-type cobalt transport system substrate-binding protein
MFFMVFFGCRNGDWVGADSVAESNIQFVQACGVISRIPFDVFLAIEVGKVLLSARAVAVRAVVSTIGVYLSIK